MLSDTEIKTLESVLFDPRWDETGLDFFGVHGAVCASAVGPDSLDGSELFAIATGQEPEEIDSAPETFSEVTGRLERLLRQALEQGHDVELPEPEDEGNPDDALENWCAGFVDAFLLHEERWLETAAEEVAALLAPVMALSNLFDDEAFQQARKDERRRRQYAEQIPDALTDLYLHFHAP